MIKIFAKNNHVKLSESIHSSEIQCRCQNPSCRHFLFDDELVYFFRDLRKELNSPLMILSGFRCSLHNTSVGGKILSRHLLGQAIDIAKPMGISFETFSKCCSNCFPYVLPYPDNNFCHCDTNLR